MSGGWCWRGKEKEARGRGGASFTTRTPEPKERGADEDEGHVVGLMGRVFRRGLAEHQRRREPREARRDVHHRPALPAPPAGRSVRINETERLKKEKEKGNTQLYKKKKKKKKETEKEKEKKKLSPPAKSRTPRARSQPKERPEGAPVAGTAQAAQVKCPGGRSNAHCRRRRSSTPRRRSRSTSSFYVSVPSNFANS